MDTNLAKQRIRRVATCLLVAGVAVTATWFGLAAMENRRETPPPIVDASTEKQTNRADDTTIDVPQRVVELNHMAIATAEFPKHERQLTLRGELTIDPTRMVHLHARFPGTIVEIATIDEEPKPPMSTSPGRRQLAFMDRVTKGQPMAKMWSKDLGEKKSELVDALVRLRLDRISLDRLKILAERGAISERDLRDQERQVQTGEIAVDKALRTLRSWELSDEEIAHVISEADRAREHKVGTREQDQEWARVELKAPIDGTIVEWNVPQGETVTDTTADLFKIADLSTLQLNLHAYEEDLPYLQRLPKPIPVMIILPSSPEVGPLPAAIEKIGDIIDQSEHMALLIGHIDNPRDDLRVGQFVKGSITLPPEEGIVEVPTRAVVLDDGESIVFVQENPNEYRFKPRRVKVVRQFYDVTHIRSQLSDEQKAAGLQELHPGERVVASETVQLKAALRQKQLQAPSPRGSEPPAQP
jgi:cobalt-zinc-cadmium efflux system membrane fusion protein